MDDQLLSRHFAPPPTVTDRLRALPPSPPPPPRPATLAAAAAAAADAATTAAAAARARARLAVGALSVTAESAAEIEAGVVTDPLPPLGFAAPRGPLSLAWGDNQRTWARPLEAEVGAEPISRLREIARRAVLARRRPMLLRGAAGSTNP